MAEAKLNREYALRLIGVGAIMLGMAAWSVYDGSVAWPRANKSLESVRGALLAASAGGAVVTPEEWLAPPRDGAAGGSSRLDAVFAAAGKGKAPARLAEELASITSPGGQDEDSRKARAAAADALFGKPLYPGRKLHSQYVQAAVAALLALLAFWAVGSKRGVRFTATDEGLGGGGFGADEDVVPWDDVASVDWRKWGEKGIAFVVLRSGRRVKLDSWHFVGMSGIAAELEKRFPRPSGK